MWGQFILSIFFFFFELRGTVYSPLKYRHWYSLQITSKNLELSSKGSTYDNINSVYHKYIRGSSDAMILNDRCLSWEGSKTWETGAVDI